MEKARVLVVDDDEALAEHIAGILGRHFAVVVTACGGAEGLRSAIAEKPDLIVTDVQMPDVSGVELLQRLKDAKVETRVIFCTGYEKNLRDTVRFMKMGVCDVVHKPFEPEEIIFAAKRSLALDSPLSLYQTEPWTILEKAMAENFELDRKFTAATIERLKVSKELKKLEKRAVFEGVVARLVYLAAGAGLTVLLYRLNMIERGTALYVLPLLLFVLLSLPIDQIKTFIAKWRKVEGRATFK
jgi:DNA-binding response OmpR family regulator